MVHAMSQGRPYDPRETDEVAAWFFRLNGCLTIRNFIIHGTRRTPQLTDADVVALRFPHRRERDWADHVIFAEQERPRLLLVEVKAGGRCQFNNSWMDPDGGILSYALERIGCYANAERDHAVERLQESGGYSGSSVDAALVAVAESRDSDLATDMPDAVQLPWRDIFDFMLIRFPEREKNQHDQWDPVGRRLHQMAGMARRDRDVFERLVREAFFPGPRAG